MCVGIAFVVRSMEDQRASSPRSSESAMDERENAGAGEGPP